MRGMGWGVPMLVAGLGIPIVLLALWGWRIAGDVTTGLTVRVDRAASEGTANLPTLLTADMVLVTNGPRPLTSSPPAPVNGPSISPSPARPGWHCCFSSLNPAPIRRDSPRVNLSYMQRAPRPECDARFARAGGISVWSSSGGGRLSINLSNAFGSEPLQVETPTIIELPDDWPSGWPHPFRPTSKAWETLHMKVLAAVYAEPWSTFTTKGCLPWRVATAS